MSFAPDAKGPEMNFQLTGRFMCVAALATLLPACAPPPQYSNVPDFARREPPAGRPGYAETIKYIDDGVRYVDPTAGFFVSPDGRMCFRHVLDPTQTAFETLVFKNNWCLPPTAVSRVDAFRSITNEQLRLVCKHSDPQCARNLGFWNGVADAVIVDIVPANEEKSAVENLIYLMGGDIDREPVK
jgi:hypothetical protein